MGRRVAVALAPALAFALFSGAAIAPADVGGTVRSEVARAQFSKTFRGVALEHGSIAGGLERWQLAIASLESRSLTIDGTSLDGRVVRETFIVRTQQDPYTLRPPRDAGELRDVLMPSEYRDFTGARLVAVVSQVPIHVTATFYRGARAAYEVLEPMRRSYGSSDRFEWRSFKSSELARTIARARNCDNGEDCATWF